MTKKILSVLLSIFVIAALFTGCGSQKVDNTDTVDLIGKEEEAEETNYVAPITDNVSDTAEEEAEETNYVASITDNVSDTAEEQSIDNIYNDNAVNSTTEESIDYEILGIKKYEYPLEFSIGDNLKTAITQLALSYDNFDEDSVSSGDWKEIFIARFIQNSRVSFDYLDMISDKNNGHIQADELNYIQFSLTSIELDFSSYVDGSINRMDSASPLNYGWISDYVYEYTDNGVIVTADFEVGTDGTDATQKRCITVELVKNPYSCFDGYSIVAISSKTVAPCSEEQGESVSDKVQADLYEGEYCDYDVNEPSLEIKKNDDETYQIQMDIFRMWYFHDGVGRMTEDGLEFTATGPWEKEVNGIVKLEEDIATVTILGQAWLDFSSINEFKFYKTSDIPNIFDLESVE